MKTISRLLSPALILLICLTTARAINPQKEYTYTPKDFGIEYVEDSVVTSDGYRINIWISGICPAPGKMKGPC